MSLRPPSKFASGGAAGAGATGFDLLGHEIMAEKAAALGDAGDRAARALVALRAYRGGPEGREAVLKRAAQAVHQWFIQRELCGMRRHEGVIKALDIPREVLVRLGAS